MSLLQRCKNQLAARARRHANFGERIRTRQGTLSIVETGWPWNRSCDDYDSLSFRRTAAKRASPRRGAISARMTFAPIVDSFNTLRCGRQSRHCFDRFPLHLTVSGGARCRDGRGFRYHRPRACDNRCGSDRGRRRDLTTRRSRTSRPDRLPVEPACGAPLSPGVAGCNLPSPLRPTQIPRPPPPSSIGCGR